MLIEIQDSRWHLLNTCITTESLHFSFCMYDKNKEYVWRHTWPFPSVPCHIFLGASLSSVSWCTLWTVPKGCEFMCRQKRDICPYIQAAEYNHNVFKDVLVTCTNYNFHFSLHSQIVKLTKWLLSASWSVLWSHQSLPWQRIPPVGVGIPARRTWRELMLTSDFLLYFPSIILLSSYRSLLIISPVLFFDQIWSFPA